jgi:hypothetical protein
LTRRRTWNADLFCFAVLVALAQEPSPSGRDRPDSGSDPAKAEPATGVTPFEEDKHTPPPEPPKPLDPKATYMVRMHAMVGPQWRIRDIEALLSLGVEYGKMSGFSGALHVTMIPPPPRNDFERTVRVLESGLAAGAIARGRLKKPLYGSIGLLVGIRIHRAATDDQVVHRVDPDLVLPIQGAWTIKKAGMSLALVQGYSFRDRAYESRGEVLWRRSAYRVGLMFGIHLDLTTRPKTVDRKRRRGHNRR